MLSTLHQLQIRTDKSVQQKSDCEHNDFFYCIKYYWPEAVLFPRRNHEAWEREERGRDNRHSRHIKTRQEDVARQSNAEQTDSGGAEYAVGLHCRVAWSSVFYFTSGCDNFNRELWNNLHLFSINDQILISFGISELACLVTLWPIHYLQWNLK